MFCKFGHVVVPLRFPLLLLWVALALLLGATAPSISDVSSWDQTSFLPAASDYNTARTLEVEKFAASGSASSGLLVFEREGGLTAADRGFAETVHNWLLSPQGPAIVQDVVSVFSHPEQASTLVSPNSAVMLLRVNFTVEAFQPVVNEATYAIRERVARGKPDGLAVHFTGEAALGTDLVAGVAESSDRTAIVTFVLVVVLLFFIYRAPLAVLTSLITITLAYLVARGTLGYLAQLGWQISSLLDTYLVVLVFGAGANYSLFFISRFREELAQNSAYEAAVRSVERIGAVIAVCAITTIVGLSALGMARFGILKTMGPGLALAVGITLLAGLTLTPASLSLFGRHLFWPLKTNVENSRPSSLWIRLSNLVARRPLISVALITVLLAIPYVGLLQYRENLGVVASLPQTSDSRQGFDAIARHFPRSEFAPAVALVELPESADLTAAPVLRAIAAMQAELLGLETVGLARTVIDPVGDGITSGFTVPAQLAEIADVQQAVRQDLRTVGVVSVVGIYAVLAILLQSLVAPLYLVGTVVFSYGSSLGLSTLFFQGVLGHEGVYHLVPLTVMVMLIALGTDCGVFLVHRIREESENQPLRDGVRVASARTGAIITAAGVILAGTFAALTASPLQMIFQMGAAVALGILINALVVRSLLVPGIVTLVGKANWWPASIKANWQPLLPAGAKTPLVGEQGLARGAVLLAVGALIAVTFATRGIWIADITGDSAEATSQSNQQTSPLPTPTPQLLVVPPAAPTPTLSRPPTQAPAPTPLPTPAPAEYVVQAGDTLSAIAREFGVTIAALAAYNEIADPNAIRVGQHLRIPPP